MSEQYEDDFNYEDGFEEEEISDEYSAPNYNSSP